LNLNLKFLIEEVQAVNKSDRFNREGIKKLIEFYLDGPDNHRLVAMFLGGSVILHSAVDW